MGAGYSDRIIIPTKKWLWPHSGHYSRRPLYFSRKSCNVPSGFPLTESLGTYRHPTNKLLETVFHSTSLFLMFFYGLNQSVQSARFQGPASNCCGTSAVMTIFCLMLTCQVKCELNAYSCIAMKSYVKKLEKTLKKTKKWDETANIRLGADYAHPGPRVVNALTLQNANSGVHR